MATVTVSQPSVIQVQVGGKQASVQSLSYGARTLKSATDLSLTGGQDGEAIVYDAANNSFILAPAVPGDVDGGFF